MLTLFAEAAGPDLLHSGAMKYMLDGGIFMWPILFMAILGVAVVIERFRALRFITVDGQTLRAEVIDLLNQDKVEEAIALCGRSRGPVPAILAVGLHRYAVLRQLEVDPVRIEEQVIKAMEDYAVHITAALERNLPVLSTIASVAPMVGSLGTVVGMVVLFQGIVGMPAGTSILKVAAEGIQLKLIVTVWGLAVGIPAYIFFNYFMAAVNRHILEAEETASQLIEALTLRLAATSRGETAAFVAPIQPAPAPKGGKS